MIEKNEMFDKLLEDRGFRKYEKDDSLVVYEQKNISNRTGFYIIIMTYPYPCNPNYDIGSIIVKFLTFNSNNYKPVFIEKYDCDMEDIYKDILRKLDILKENKDGRKISI